MLLRGNGVEGGVDRPGLDGADRGTDVGIQGHDVQFDVRMLAVEVLQEHCWCDPPADDIDAQSTPAGAHGRVSPLRYPEEFAGVRKERLPVDGELGPAGRAGE